MCAIADVEDRDSCDGNDACVAVPYDFVRPGGRSGNCFAVTYKQGAEYVLLLRRNAGQDKSGDLSPYWAALAPTNEQVAGTDDPWVRWIAAQLKRSTLSAIGYRSPVSDSRRLTRTAH